MATAGDYQDPYDQPYPTQTPTPTPTAPTGGGPIASWDDPRLVNVSLGNDPAVLDWINRTTPGTPTYDSTLPPNPGGGRQGGSGGVAPTAHDDPGATAPPPTTVPPPTPGPIGGPPPAPTPSVTPPLPTPPPAFHYDDFTAPDPNDLSSDPGFQFENAQGMQAIGARNAALGTLNTGGTLKDYVSFGQNLAHTRYGDLFNRKLTQYGTNRGNALDAYNTNYNTQVKDPWTESMQRASMDQNTNQFNNTQGFNEWLENYKRSTLDPFDQRYKTLSLLGQ